MITDIIVSTNSAKIAIIAKWIGVTVKWREKYLCEDEVMPDSVMVDVIPADIL